MEHSFDIEIAQKFGINAAILYRHFQFWIVKNKANKKHFYNGRTWTYNSVRGFIDQFPYLSAWHIRKAIKVLIENNIIIESNYNKQGYDRTKWYGFRDEKTALKAISPHLCNSQMDSINSANASENITNGFENSTNPIYKNRKPIPDPIPDNIPDKKTNNNCTSVQEKLDLDLQIADQSKFFMKKVQEIFRLTKKEAITFANITKYLISECQSGNQQISIFKDAVLWAIHAKRSNATNPKGLFVSKIKQETGFSAQTNLLNTEPTSNGQARAGP